VIRYNKKRNPKPKDVKDNSKLEILWTVVPTILVLIMFYYGWIGYTPMRKVPNGAITVKATGMMWTWDFEYENGKRSNTLVVPLGKPVKLELYSPDVLHSLYIPAFRIKEDVVPGVKNMMWFQSDKIGEYDILCAEYCGVRHSYMLSKVIVKPENEFVEWYQQVTDTAAALEPVGLQVLKKNACMTCHSMDGSKIVGPSFKAIMGKSEKVKDASGKVSTITVDEAYIKTSIFEPDLQIVDGYNKGLMISYKDRINEEEIKEIVKYLETLK
jgi:cytochrome c oxidase subunit 2